ncbi:MAG: BTAD domain-containing putative transcriptional regulator [Oscillospiraceae bacterium]
MAKAEEAAKGQEILVRFFGNFQVVIDGQVINESASRTKRPWNLLQYLMVFRHKTVSRQQLIEALWPDGASEQPDKALKNLVYRVRSSFAAKGVPFSQEIIQYVNGSYQLNNRLNWAIDFEQFEGYYDKMMKQDTPDDAAIGYALQAVDLYRGDFLAEHVYDDWVLPYNTYYRSLFFKCVDHALDLLEKEERDSDIEFICSRALMVDQFEESLHLAYMNALIRQDKKPNAVAHYNKMADMFFREMGVTPSDELRDLYHEISQSLNKVQTDLYFIKETLCEKEVSNDAFFCDFEVFKSLYRLEARSAQRAGQAVFIVLLTLFDKNDEQPGSEQLTKSMSLLFETVNTCLRRGDVVSRFSISQYILMLPTVTIENAEMVLRRITDRFNRLMPFPNVRLEAKIQPLDPLVG